LDQALDEIKQSKIQKFNTMEELRKDLLYWYIQDREKRFGTFISWGWHP
jgi:hypothetical protein